MDSGKKQNRYVAALKKNIVGLIGILIVMSLAACSNKNKPEASEGAAQNVQTEQETAEVRQETEIVADDLPRQQGGISQPETAGSESHNQDTKESSVNQQENSAQAIGNSDPEMTAEELFDLFINGSINAVDSTDLTSAFYITDLKMDAEEGDSFSIGERVDLDNDGENELIICGPYGGIYLDARDNKVYEFAAVDGNALILSYTYYNGAIWIMYSSRSSAGFEFYHMEKFEGADNLVAEMNFGEGFADPNNVEAGMKYTLNEAEISYDEYTELCSKILAAEVNTD